MQQQKKARSNGRRGKQLHLDPQRAGTRTIPNKDDEFDVDLGGFVRAT